MNSNVKMFYSSIIVRKRMKKVKIMQKKIKKKHIKLRIKDYKKN